MPGIGSAYIDFVPSNCAVVFCFAGQSCVNNDDIPGTQGSCVEAVINDDISGTQGSCVEATESTKSLTSISLVAVKLEG